MTMPFDSMNFAKTERAAQPGKLMTMPPRVRDGVAAARSFF
jgi:hypothetical protein